MTIQDIIVKELGTGTGNLGRIFAAVYAEDGNRANVTKGEILSILADMVDAEIVICGEEGGLWISPHNPAYAKFLNVPHGV